MSRDGLIYGCTENITTRLPPLLSSPLPRWRKETDKRGGEEKIFKNSSASLYTLSKWLHLKGSLKGAQTFPQKGKKTREQSNIVSRKVNEQRKAMWDCTKTAGYCDKQRFSFRPQKLMARCLLAKRHMAWPHCVWATLSHCREWRTHKEYYLQTRLSFSYSVFVPHLSHWMFYIFIVLSVSCIESDCRLELEVFLQSFHQDMMP